MTFQAGLPTGSPGQAAYFFYPASKYTIYLSCTNRVMPNILGEWLHFAKKSLSEQEVEASNLLEILVPEVGIEPTRGGSPAGF